MVRLFESVHPLIYVGARRLLAVAAALALSAAGCGGAPPDADAPPGGPGGPGGFAVPVEMVSLTPRPVERASELVATVKSRRSTTIQPQAEGFLTRILVTSGQRVTPGTPLFEVDSATQEAAVRSLQSQRAAREADVTYARQQAARARSLLDVGATSQQAYEQAVAQTATAEAQLATLDEQIRQQQAELAYYGVVSPTTGVIGDVPVRVGDRVTRATVLTTVDDNAGLEVYIQVPVQQAQQLRVGLPVQVLDDSGEVIATEKVAFVASSVDDATQTVLAKAPLAQRAGVFRSDQLVRVRLIWNTTPTLVIPVVATLRVAGQYFVYIAEAGEGGMLVARQRQVTLGPMVGNEYVLEGGLSEGDQLIVGGIQKIGDGAPVQAAPPGGAPVGRGGQ